MAFAQSKISTGAANIMRLADTSGKEDGWASVSAVRWPAIAVVPDELMEKDGSIETGGRCRLTDEGRTLLKWIVT